MEELSRFGVSLPAGLLVRFDRIVAEKGYANRSEAIRDLIRDFIVEEEWRKGEEVVATVSMVFTHEGSIAEKLLNIQHHNHILILSSMHLHLDQKNCLEVLVLKGRASEVKALSEKIIAIKGIKHGRFVMTTTGAGLL